MKRRHIGLLVWLLCLSTQVGALSVPYAHIHRDATHATDHHDGRQIHRHGPTHHHEHQDQSKDQQDRTDAAVVNPTAGPVAKLDVTRPTTTPLTMPASIRGSVFPRVVAASLPGDESDSPPGDPPPPSSPLRGPPR